MLKCVQIYGEYFLNSPFCGITEAFSFSYCRKLESEGRFSPFHREPCRHMAGRFACSQPNHIKIRPCLNFIQLFVLFLEETFLVNPFFWDHFYFVFSIFKIFCDNFAVNSRSTWNYCPPQPLSHSTTFTLSRGIGCVKLIWNIISKLCPAVFLVVLLVSLLNSTTLISNLIQPCPHTQIFIAILFTEMVATDV